VRVSLIVLFEHAPRVARLVDRLRSRRVAVTTVDIRLVATADLDPGPPATPVLNRIGAFPAGGGDPGIVLAAREYLARLESRGRRVFNGADSYRVATSKVEQARVITELGLRAPNHRAVHDAGELTAAAVQLRYPLIFKPNVGGSGVGIRVLEDPDQLAALAADPEFTLGVDGVGLLQEYHSPQDGRIVRLELVNGKLLYGSSQPVIEGAFNYCAVGGCHAGTGAIAVLEPPPDAVEEARQILEATRADFGAVEYVVSERDEERYWFDINPFSNYLENNDLLGFDPDDRLAGYLAEAIG